MHPTLLTTTKRGEHMTNEIYSGQTRQTRTALILFSTALALQTTVGDPPDHYTVPPGFFTLPEWTLFWLLFVSSCYFLASFWYSARYDTELHPYIDQFSQLRTKINEINESISDAQNSVTKFESDVSTYIKDEMKLIGGVNTSGLRRRVKVIKHEKTIAALNAIILIKTKINSLGRKSAGDQLTKKIRDPLRYIDNAASEALEILEKELTQVRGLRNFKINSLEFRLPLIYSILMIAIAIQAKARGIRLDNF